MKLNYAIFRTEAIYKLSDLSQIGSHNKRDKKSYNSNPDINIELSKNNIEIVPLTDKYVKGFYNIVKDYKKEHDDRMKTEREERKRSFNDMLDKSRNVVADELLFTASHDFFKDMSRYEIKRWGDTCMEFVYEDIGYKREQVLHAVMHMDEKTPHLHCVVVPLVKKFDKRTNSERFTISKKQYVKDKAHLSALQDKYYKRLVDKGFDLERGIKNSDNEHISIKEFKKITRKLNNELNHKNERLNKAMCDFENKIKSNKETLFDKDYVKVKKDTFDSMKNVVSETKKVMKIQPKLEKVYDEIKNYTVSYSELEKENKNMSREINLLRYNNQKLNEENKRLYSYITDILEKIKIFFREVLKYGNYLLKDKATDDIKMYYDNNDFTKDDVIDICIDTDKEKELFDYTRYGKDIEI